MKTIICKDVYGNEYEVNPNELEQRLGVYAVIVRDNKILLTRQWDGYSLVGGGVDKGETLEDALVREVKEETGVDIEPGEIFYHATTYFKKDAEASPKQSFQFYFTAKNISGEIDHANITESEKGYTLGAPEWVSFNDVADITFRHSVDLQTILDTYPDL